MKLVKNYILSQVAARTLSKSEALPLLQELSNQEGNSARMEDIAVIGMACRLPQAGGPEEFWSNLIHGVDSIGDFPDSRKRDVDAPIRDYFKNKRNAPEIKYRRGAYLNRIDLFDAEFFNITPAEARCMDPLQRIFLEVSWEALEDAGYAEKELNGSRTGVYVGDTDADYLKLIQEMEPYALPGNTISIVASRLAYILNLASGSHLIDTACSASLAAVHHAIKGLITGDCEMALAGGLNLTLFPIDEGLADIGIASTDYKARTFDADANGTVWGEGFCTVVLKKLKNAKRDRDHIYAVIKGSAMNSDGKSNGITAPSARAQSELIQAAWRNAGIPLETMTYLEAHGTGTRLGDPIEMQGITGAIRSSTDHQQFCALGAVKTNIGHLDTAAGLAGFMKTVLALKHQAIPATLHFHDPNPHIDFMNSPVFVNTELMPWTTSNGVPRRAGVSAFGLAGTNCHVVLEEYQGDAPSAAGIPEGPEISILTLSAKSRGSFDALLERFILYLPDTPYTLRDICITSNTGRGHYAYRLAVAAASLDDLLGKLLLLRDTADSDRAFLKKAGIHYAYLEQRKNRSYNAKPNTDLNRLLDEYATGSEIQWEDWYGKHQGRRVPIPVYPFSGKRHWINYIPEQETVSVPQQPAVRNMDDCFYSLQWVPKELDAAKAAALPAGEAWLLFTDDTGVGVFLFEHMKQAGLRPVLVEAGDSFTKMQEDSYKLCPETPGHFEQLIVAVTDGGHQPIGGVVHLWTCTEIRSGMRNPLMLRESQIRGAESLLYLLKGFKAQNIAFPHEIRAVSNYAHLVTPEDGYLFPEKAPLWGLMKVVSQEYMECRCSCMDVETIGRKSSDVALEIMQELRHVESAEDYGSAWRNGKRYTQQLGRMKVQSLPERDIRLRENGVYLIAGGAGAVGLETCRYLAGKTRARLVIVNRTPLPKRQEWERLAGYSADTPVSSRIAELLRLEELGAEVHYYAADITDLTAMKAVMADVEARLGPVHGIIHSAMQLEHERLEQLDIFGFRRAADTKVIGAWVLQELAEEQNADFVLLYSSAASILGGVGLGGYAAGNAFMDQFAHYHSRRGAEMLSINWSFLEMGATAVELAAVRSLSLPVSAGDFALILDRLFQYRTSQALIARIRGDELKTALKLLKVHFAPELISALTQPTELTGTASPEAYQQTIHAYQELKRWLQQNDAIQDIIQRDVELGSRFVSFEEHLYSALQSDTPAQLAQKLTGRTFAVKLKDGEDDNYLEMERRLGQIWGEVLGLEEIGVHTDFFENGDSLMLMSVISRIKNDLSIDIPIQIFYQEPTVSGLSQWLLHSEELEADDSDDIPVLPRFYGDLKDPG